VTAAPAQRRAVVVGAGGQDGTLLSAHLRALGYEVVGVNRVGVLRPGRDTQALDLLDAAQAEAFLSSCLPDEIYFLAAHHHSSEEDAGGVFQLLRQSYETHCQRFLNVLEASVRHVPRAHIFYAASALVFGHPDTHPQDEKTPMRPVCPYGVTKLYGMGLCEIYRRDFGLFCTAGILFNHESPLRQPRFVTRKISRAVAAIKRGEQRELSLGSLDAEVDWSAAEDFVEAMRLSLAIDVPQDFVFASGKLHSLREFCELAFAAAGLDYRDHVKTDAALLVRGARRIPLHGNPQRLMAATGWRPKVSFEALVSGMVRAELEQAS
jgi:GDPmannose 4,6-dehydratase